MKGRKMTAIKKIPYEQVKCLYASLRQTSLEAAQEGLPPVLRNKRGFSYNERGDYCYMDLI
jgi:hypothetical protein